MKTKLLTTILILSIILLSANTAFAALTLTQVDRDHVLVRFDDAPNVAAYNFQLIGCKVINAEYQGGGDKYVDFNPRNGKIIVYGMNGNTVGSGDILCTIKAWGKSEIKINDSVCSDPDATMLEITDNGLLQTLHTTIK